ncbi:MAG: tetratricopeptide repeat protein [bacterium]
MAKKLLLLVAAAAIILSFGCDDEKEFVLWSQAQWTAEGWARWRGADYDGAVTAFGNALKVDPYYAEAHGGLGWTYIRMQTMEDAADVFEDAVMMSEQAGTKEQVKQVIYMGATTAYEAIDEYKLSAARGRYMIKNLDGANFKFKQAVDPEKEPTVTGYDLYIVLTLDYYGLGEASDCVWAINRMRGVLKESTDYKFKNWKETTAEIERLIKLDPS